MMTSIVEKFGRGNREPVLPPVPRPTPPTPPAAPHEHAAKALLFVSGLNDEVEYLRSENNRLRADLNLALMRNADLERAMAEMRRDMEAYRRYSVEVKTHLQHICDAAMRANEAALDAGEPEVSGAQTEKIITQLAEDINASAIAAKYGADSAELQQ